MTLLLERLNEGDSSASNELLPLVYDELRELARRLFLRSGGADTLQATDLVHEVYLKMLGTEGNRKAWDGRRHFFAVAATAMRRVLTDYARRGGRAKRGGHLQRVTLSEASEGGPEALGLELDLIELNDALEELDALSPRIARVIELRFFSGMTVEEVAAELGVSDRMVFKDWRAGRALLRRRLESAENETEA